MTHWGNSFPGNETFPSTTAAEGGELVARIVRSVEYDRGSGRLFWKAIDGEDRFTKMRNTRFAGRPAGCKKPSGYVYVRVGDQEFLAHRIVWLLVYGRWPNSDIDHVNGDPSDNRIENLRECAPWQNAANRDITKSNTSGFKGVCWHKHRSKWMAQIQSKGRHRVIGYFDDPVEASAAYERVARNLFGDFHRVVKP